MNALAANAEARRVTPRGTARLQFHGGFTLDDAIAIVSYLDQLGISHVYASPLLAARSGSSHGYDVVDPTRINPELGGKPALQRLVAALRERQMGLILDIVPNHMAANVENPWWRDVLEWGQESPHADVFDIDWEFPDPKLRGRVLVPTLGRPRNDLLAEGDIELMWSGEASDADRANAPRRIHMVTAGQHFPLAASAYSEVLGTREALADLAAQFAQAAPGSTFDAALAALHRSMATEAGRSAVEQALAHYSAATPEGRQRLDRLLASQPYLLAPWTQAWHRINWRRFFDITDLIAIRPDRPEVFEATHALVLQLYAEGLIDGLRIDHIDGLIDPAGYCRMLRDALRQAALRRPAGAPRGEAYLIVEKILAPGETLREDWDVDGTTGYEFMDQVAALLHDPEAAEPLREFWQSQPGAMDYEAHVLDARRQMTLQNFAADLDTTVRAVRALARQDDDADSGIRELREALVELIVHFPVYRTYTDTSGADRVDAQVLEQAVTAVLESGNPVDEQALDLLQRWLSGNAPDEAQEEAARVIRRFQRLTPPIAAKALEDTTFYRYGRLLSRNEVGAEPNQFSLSIEEFHAACMQRQRSTPHSLLCTATHDHKRGEDARVRLAVLSEMPGQWIRQVCDWQSTNAGGRTLVEGTPAPDATDELMLYQTLVGAWPLQLDPADDEAVDALRERMAQWQQKALRESKRHSSWSKPNDAYEQACQDFLGHLLSRKDGHGYLDSLAGFVERVAPAGALNGLSQTLLRLTTPGVPDLYQGTEFWDFSLVDPDNRRPVDYDARRLALAEAAPLGELARCWKDGAVKQALIARLLDARRQQPQLFSHGDYRPLEVRGAMLEHAVAFERSHQEQSLVVIAPRLPLGLLQEQSAGISVDGSRWQDTSLAIPPGQWTELLSGTRHVIQDESTRLGGLMQSLPAAVLLRGPDEVA